MRAILLTLPILLAGCSLDAQFVAASRSTYDLIAQAHAEYIQADGSMTPIQKDRRIRKLESWEARIAEAERRVGNQ